MRQRKSELEHDLAGTIPQYVTAADLPFSGGKPKMPKDLTAEAEKEWKRLVRELRIRGTLTRADSSMLEIYVRMFSRWKTVAVLADANPVTEVSWLDKAGDEHFKTVEHPASAMAARLENSLRNMLKELSATPASRERTRPLPKEKSKNDPPPPPVEGTFLSKEETTLPSEEVDLSKIDIGEHTVSTVPPEMTVSDENRAFLEEILREEKSTCPPK